MPTTRVPAPTAVEPTTIAAEVQRLLYKLVRDYENCDRMCLGRYGVTAAQGYTLLNLGENATVNMNELSQAMGLANSTMTRMVDQLVRKGLARRRPGDEDRRVVLVELTEEGHRTRQSLAEAQQELFRLVLEEIPDEKREAIVATLRVLGQSLEKASTWCCSQ